MPVSLCWGAQTRHPALSLTSAGQRDRIPPFALLTALLLTQHGMQSAFGVWVRYWLLGNFPSTWTPRSWSFLQSCLLSSQLPACTTARGYSTPDAALCTSLYWASWGSSQLISPARLGPPERQHCPPVYSLVCPIWYCLHTSWWCAPSHHSSHE